MATFKHLVKSGKPVIFDGILYKPNKDGHVSLPGVFETAEVEPLERPAPVAPKKQTKVQATIDTATDGGEGDE